MRGKGNLGKITIGFLLFLTLIGKPSKGAKIDSLAKLYRTEPSSQRRVEIINQIHASLHFGQKEQAAYWFRKKLKEAKIQNNLELELENKIRLAEITFEGPQADSAFIMFREVEDRYEEIPDRQDRLFMKVILHGIWSRVERQREEYDESVRHMRISIAATKERGNDSLLLAHGFTRLGNVFSRMNQYDSAVLYHSKALDMAKKGSPMYIISLGNLGHEYQQIGKYEEARSVLLEAYNGHVAAKAVQNGLRNLVSMGMMILKRNPKLIDISFIQPMLQAAKVENVTGFAHNMVRQSRQQPNTAIKALAAECAMKIYMAYGPADSLDSALKYIQTVTKQQTEELLESRKQDAQVKYETLKKEQQNFILAGQLANEQFRKNSLVIGLMALALIMMLIIWQFLNLRKSKRAVEEKNQIISQQAAELLERDEFKSRFFANVSHELRTPLTLVLGPLENLIQQDSITIPDGALAQMKLTMSNARKLQTMVNEILDLTKLEAGKLELNLHSVKINQFLRRVFFAFESLTASRKIHLSFQGQVNEDISLHIDHDKVEKVVNNLVSNAIKFSQDGGTIEIGLTQTGEELFEIRVKDQGAGIATEDLENVFDRYYQSLNHHHSGGTGIGLALARELAHLMNGSLKVESKLGEGATFIFSFKASLAESGIVPGVDDDLESLDLSYDGQIDLSFDEKPNVLVVEDNIEMRGYIRNVLSRDFKVYEAANGQEGLNILGVRQIDLITSDVMMPEMGGYEFLETVKAHVAWKNLPFIMLTARADEDEKLSALEVGIDDYITKPFYARELLARVKNLLNNLQSRREELDQRESQEDTQTDDDSLIEKLINLVKAHLDDTDFTVAALAEEIGYSERQVLRKVKKLKGVTLTNFIKEIRLVEARKMLEQRRFGTVAEVGYACGFKTPSYFAGVFFKRFGKKPNEYFD